MSQSQMTALLMEALSGDTVQQMSNAIGADERSTKTAVTAALPFMLGALTKNTSSASGAEGLLGALDRDHDGSILDDVAGMLGGAASSSGGGILGHMFGNSLGGVEKNIGKASGLDMASVAKLMAMLAPIVMGVLGRQKRQSTGLDATGLAGMLAGEYQSVQKAAPDAMSSLAQLLDADGDGDISDDVAKIGGSLLGQFFK